MSVEKGTKFRSPINGKEYRTSKDCYYVRVRARSLKVGFRMQRKQKRLEEAIKQRKQEISRRSALSLLSLFC